MTDPIRVAHRTIQRCLRDLTARATGPAPVEESDQITAIVLSAVHCADTGDVEAELALRGFEWRERWEYARALLEGVQFAEGPTFEPFSTIAELGEAIAVIRPAAERAMYPNRHARRRAEALKLTRAQRRQRRRSRDR